MNRLEQFLKKSELDKDNVERSSDIGNFLSAKLKIIIMLNTYL